MPIQLEMGTQMLEIDPANLPTGDEFKKLLEKLKKTNTNIENIKQLVHLYRNNEACSFSILELLPLTEDESDQISDREIESLILAAALHIHHRRDPNVFFKRLKYVRDKRVDLLKGFHLLNSGEFEDAEFLFGNIGYKQGLERVYLVTNKARVTNSGYFPVQCYTNSRVWRSKVNTNEFPVDFLYRIGHSDRFEDPSNVDVQLRKISEEMDSVPFKETRKKLENLLGPERKKEYAEIYYLIGKTYHLEREYKMAVVNYEKAIAVDPEYKPAQWNLIRIRGLSADNMPSEYESVCNYRSLRELNKGVKTPSTEGCSESVSKIIHLAASLTTEDKSSISTLERVIQSLEEKTGGSEEEVTRLYEKEVIYNNTAILIGESNITRAEELLKKAMKCGNRKYSGILEYNLGVLKKDVRILQESPFEEALQHVALITGEESQENKPFLMMGRGGVENIDRLAECVENAKSVKEQLVCVLCLGSLLIDCFLKSGDVGLLDRAQKAYEKFPTSFYAVNGLGVVYALKGKPEAALELFQQVAFEFNGAYLNMAKCHFMMGDYRTGVMMLVKCLSESGVIGVIRQGCRMANDESLVKWCMSQGVPGLESVSSVDYTQDSKMNEERKRMIEELKESRKKMQF